MRRIFILVLHNTFLRFPSSVLMKDCPAILFALKFSTIIRVVHRNHVLIKKNGCTWTVGINHYLFRMKLIIDGNQTAGKDFKCNFIILRKSQGPKCRSYCHPLIITVSEANALSRCKFPSCIAWNNSYHLAEWLLSAHYFDGNDRKTHAKHHWLVYTSRNFSHKLPTFARGGKMLSSGTAVHVVQLAEKMCLGKSKPFCDVAQDCQTPYQREKAKISWWDGY